MLNRGLSVWHLLEFATNSERIYETIQMCALMAARLHDDEMEMMMFG